ncbi:hypothetical protein Ndes2437B_g05435 [Nannochloris sp. 'desiccata']
MSSLSWRQDWETESHPFSTLPPPAHPTFDLYTAIDAALQEDAGDFGDITTLSTVPEATTASATFLAKAEGVLAGVYVAQMVFRRVDPAVQVTWLVDDSSTVRPGQIIATITGSARSILIAERVALNFMQRMSGIATMTAAMVKAVRCTKATILDTRKTVPGLRLLDKWAVAIGGGANHRIGLYDMVMIKDNHIAAAHGIRNAVDGAVAFMQSKGIQRPMEVETRTLDELKEVLEILDAANVSSTGDESGTNSGGITRIMLDNMTRKDTGAPSGIDVSTLHEAMALIGDRKIETEASGNVTLATVGEIAKTGVQFISCGALTHSVTALDISLNIETHCKLHCRGIDSTSTDIMASFVKRSTSGMVLVAMLCLLLSNNAAAARFNSRLLKQVTEEPAPEALEVAAPAPLAEEVGPFVPGPEGEQVSASEALFSAIRAGDVEEVQSLLPDTDTDVYSPEGTTPLIEAIALDDEEIFDALLEKGVDTNLPSTPDGNTPLFYTITLGRLEWATRLLDAGADINLANAAGDTPLFAAIKATPVDYDAVELLLMRSPSPTTSAVDFDVTDAEGRTAQQVAEETGDEQLIGLFQNLPPAGEMVTAPAVATTAGEADDLSLFVTAPADEVVGVVPTAEAGDFPVVGEGVPVTETVDTVALDEVAAEP